MNLLREKIKNDPELREEIKLFSHALYAMSENDVGSLNTINKELNSETLKAFERDNEYLKEHEIEYQTKKYQLVDSLELKSNVSSTGSSAGEIGITLPPRINSELHVIAANQGFITPMCTVSNDIYDSTTRWFPSFTLQATPQARTDESADFSSSNSAFSAANNAVSPVEYGFRTLISDRVMMINSVDNDFAVNAFYQVMITLMYRTFDIHLMQYNIASTSDHVGLIKNNNIKLISPSATIASGAFNQGILEQLFDNIDYRIDRSRVAYLVSSGRRRALTGVTYDSVAPSSAYMKLAGDRWFDGILVKDVPTDIMPETLQLSSNRVTSVTGGTNATCICGDFSKVYVGMSPIKVKMSTESPNAFGTQQRELLVCGYFAHVLPYTDNETNTNTKPVFAKVNLAT